MPVGRLGSNTSSPCPVPRPAPIQQPGHPAHTGPRPRPSAWSRPHPRRPGQWRSLRRDRTFRSPRRSCPACITTRIKVRDLQAWQTLSWLSRESWEGHDSGRGVSGRRRTVLRGLLWRPLALAALLSGAAAQRTYWMPDVVPAAHSCGTVRATAASSDESLRLDAQRRALQCSYPSLPSPDDSTATLVGSAGNIKGVLQCITDGFSVHECVSLKNQHGKLVCGVSGRPRTIQEACMFHGCSGPRKSEPKASTRA